MICQRILKNREERSHGLGPWVRYLEDAEVLKKLLWFFRTGCRYGGCEIPNLCSRYEDKVNHDIAATFLLSLCELAFAKHVREEWRNLHAIRPELVTARPQFIEILTHLDALPLLMRSGWEVDDACLQRLEVIAMDGEYSFPDSDRSRKPNSLAEACYAGSVTAEILLPLRTTAAERERLQKIARLQREQREADRRIRELKQD